MFDVFYIEKATGIFPHEQKVSSIEEAQSLSRTRFCWVVNYLCDYTGWDFLYEPVPWQAHQRHAWRSQWQMDSGTYLVPKIWDGVETNYHSDCEIKRLPHYEGWILPDTIDSESVDYSWHPNPIDPPYIYHFPSQHQVASGLVHIVPGAADIKLIDPFIVTALPDRNNPNWQVHEQIAEDEWDWSWHSNPLEPAYIYQWGNQWNPAQYKASVQYTVPGATDVKYMDEYTRRLPQPELYECNLPVTEFDFSWEPNPFDPPFHYIFGNQWNPAVIEPTAVYTVPGATVVKYIDDIVAVVAPEMHKWEILDDIVNFDYSWRPSPKDPPYIYVFGNQWLTPEQRPALRYVVEGATTIKYMDEPKAFRKPNTELFVTHTECNFDYSWEPDPGSPPYNYVFGNQWWPAEVMPTVEYRMVGATETKFMSEPAANLKETVANWVFTSLSFEFDTSWCPDPGDPPYIYVFGNQWHPAETMPTIEYHVPGATERKFMSEPVAKLTANRDHWTIPEEVIADNVDFSWCPDPGSPPFVYHFGTEYQTSVNLTYTVPGATEIKFAGDIPTIQKEKSAVAVLDIFYMDRSNAMSQTRFLQLQERYPHIQKIRYVNSIKDTIQRCLSKTKNNKFWVIGSENNYTDFDFSWHSQPWQSSMTHVFGSQWNKWSDTFLINRWEFERHASWAKDIEEFPNLNFVGNQQVVAPSDSTDIYVIDFGNTESKQTIEYLQSRYRVVRTARYFDNYFDTLKRLIADVQEQHIWIVASICDYNRFDFSWQPEAWQRDMLHVFPSGLQKFGDTFYASVPALQAQINSIKFLHEFETVNYCNDQKVTRWRMPVIEHTNDTHVDAVMSSNFAGPFALFTNTSTIPRDLAEINLWEEKTKTITPLDSGAGSVVVPKNAIPYIKTQLYDYPYVDRSWKHINNNAPLDIIFISNGEKVADENWKRLEWSFTNQRRNNLKRIDGINGRVASQHAAATASTTPWYFLVPAKLAISSSFDWQWQPDRMQQPKHYIFHAKNIVNGLEYGHMAMVAYNKNLVLETTGEGLDFTLDKEHEVVPMSSGISTYHYDSWMCWRTAFREVVKLRHSMPDVENEYRISKWLTTQADLFDNEFAKWSVWGAEDALEYYDQVNGDFDQLKKTYEWQWLASYAFVKRGLTSKD